LALLGRLRAEDGELDAVDRERREGELAEVLRDGDDAVLDVVAVDRGGAAGVGLIGELAEEVLIVRLERRLGQEGLADGGARAGGRALGCRVEEDRADVVDVLDGASAMARTQRGRTARTSVAFRLFW
jgi:hypothetical protein